MDLVSYGRALKRFKWLVMTGVVLAVVLGFFSFAKITSHGVAYRTNAIYQSTTTVLLTDKGSTFANPTLYGNLTDLYSQLALGSEVQATMIRDGANKKWKLLAQPVTAAANPYAVLPVIELMGQADTPANAVKEASLGDKALLQVYSSQPGAATLVVLQKPTLLTVTVVQPRKKTLLIVVVLGVLSATFALALVLDNLRPRTACAVAPDARTVPSPKSPHSSATRATA